MPARRWQTKLSRTIVLNNGTGLATLADVRAFILKEPAHIQQRNSWQRAAALLIEAAEHGGSIEAATEWFKAAVLKVGHACLVQLLPVPFNAVFRGLPPRIYGKRGLKALSRLSSAVCRSSHMKLGN